MLRSLARRENKRILIIFDAIKGKIVKKIKLGDIVQAASPGVLAGRQQDRLRGQSERRCRHLRVRSGDRRHRQPHPGRPVRHQSTVFVADGTTLAVQPQDRPLLEGLLRRSKRPFPKDSDHLRPVHRHPAVLLPGRQDDLLFVRSRRDTRSSTSTRSTWRPGTIEQYTDVTGGCFSPVELGERGDEQQLLFTAFYQGSFSLYRMPLKEPEATIEVAEAGGRSFGAVRASAAADGGREQEDRLPAALGPGDTVRLGRAGQRRHVPDELLPAVQRPAGESAGAEFSFKRSRRSPISGQPT